MLTSSLDRESATPFQIVVFKRSSFDKQPISSTNRPHLGEDIEETMEIVTKKLNEKAQARGFPVVVQVVDVASTLYHDQIKLLANSSMLVGVESTNLLAASSLPVGARRCCAVMELIPSISATSQSSLDPGASANANAIPRLPGLLDSTRAHRNNNNNNEAVLTQFGLLYRSMPIYSDSLSFRISVDTFAKIVDEVIDALISMPTCVLKDIVRNPFEIL